jgi:hypothetical protein
MAGRILALALMTPLFGCSGLVRPDDLRPAPHPLLEAFGRPGAGHLRPLGVETPATAPPARRDARALRRALDRLEGRQDVDQAGLDRAVGAALGLGGAPALRSGASVAPSDVRAGDALIFVEAPGVPRRAWVRARKARGVIEAVAITRGAVRRIVVDPAHPHARRRGDRVVNTFLRARRPDDPAGARYLAGQLLVQIRRPAR